MAYKTDVLEQNGAAADGETGAASSGNEGGAGVFAPMQAQEIVNHRPDGKFAPGNRAGAMPKPRKVTTAIIEAISDAFPPERIKHMLVRTWELAEKKENLRQMVELETLILAYLAGKPKQIHVSVRGKMGEYLQALSQAQTADVDSVVLPGADDDSM